MLYISAGVNNLSSSISFVRYKMWIDDMIRNKKKKTWDHVQQEGAFNFVLALDYPVIPHT